MKTTLAVLMLPAALFATWATNFVQEAVSEANAESAEVGAKADRVKEALDRKIENFRGSFLMDTRETMSVGAALRKGQASIDRALGRPTKDREAYEAEREELSRQIEHERAQIRAMRAADEAVAAAKMRDQLEAKENIVDPAILDEAREKAAAALEKAKEKVEAMPTPEIEETPPPRSSELEDEVRDLERATDSLELDVD